MPLIYFGYEPRNRQVTKLAVSTSQGSLEPAEPSKIKVFSHGLVSPIWSLLSGVIGLVVAILSYPKNYYVPWSVEGLPTLTRNANFIPFSNPGIAVVLKKGVKTLSEEDWKLLEAMDFTSMQYNGRTVYLKPSGITRDEFREIDKYGGIDPTGPAPARFLNTHSYRSFLVLRSFTSKIAETFHYLAEAGGTFDANLQQKNSKLLHGWKDASIDFNEEGDAPVLTSELLEFNPDATTYRAGSQSEKIANTLVCYKTAAAGIGNCNPGVVLNPLSTPFAGYISSTNGGLIKSPGVIFKFNHRLALPDPNLIGDVLGRYFLQSLGGSLEEQLENLELLKTGLGSLRLTRLGDELSHYYKCIEIAIGSNSGCIPIFTGSVYEGSIVCGGPATTLIVGMRKFPFLPVTQLKDEFLNVSDHASALNLIANYFPDDERKAVRKVKNMFDLRKMCLELSVNQDAKDDIIRKASNLDFGQHEWVISPINLKRCFFLISDPSDLEEADPIGRMTLFSKDPVLIAFSCFGEKSCPSWDIPSGTVCSLKPANPPHPPIDKRQKGSKGEISDAAWVMVIRQTDLNSAAEEFRQMAANLSYRSCSSVLAKRVGHRVFSRDRMGEFWRELRTAVQVINPLADLGEQGSLKRGATDFGEGYGETFDPSKRRRMDF